MNPKPLNDAQSYCLKTRLEMNRKLKKVADAFEDAITLQTTCDFLDCYEMGLKLNEVMADGAAYGSDAIGQLATYLGRSTWELYAWMRFAAAFSRAQVEALAGRRVSPGYHITLRHCLLLATLKSGDDRKRMIERMFDKGMSTRELERELKAAGFEKPQRARRKPRPTAAERRSPQRAVLEIAQWSYAINRRVEVWTACAFDAVDEMAPDKVDERLAAEVRKALAEVVKLRERLQPIRDGLGRLVARLRDAAAQRQKAEREASRHRVYKAWPCLADGVPVVHHHGGRRAKAAPPAADAVGSDVGGVGDGVPAASPPDDTPDDPPDEATGAAVEEPFEPQGEAEPEFDYPDEALTYMDVPDFDIPDEPDVPDDRDDADAVDADADVEPEPDLPAAAAETQPPGDAGD